MSDKNVYENLLKIIEPKKAGDREWFLAFLDAQKQKEYERKRAMSATSATCPQCGGRLYRRNGKYGEFLGCGNYPNCKYTQDR